MTSDVAPNEVLTSRQASQKEPLRLDGKLNRLDGKLDRHCDGQLDRVGVATGTAIHVHRSGQRCYALLGDPFVDPLTHFVHTAGLAELAASSGDGLPDKVARRALLYANVQSHYFLLSAGPERAKSQ
jgi:hypothetical protein